MDCSLSGSSVHGIFQGRVLAWVAISFSRGSFRPRNRTPVSLIAGRRFIVWATVCGGVCLCVIFQSICRKTRAPQGMLSSQIQDDQLRSIRTNDDTFLAKHCAYNEILICLGTWDVWILLYVALAVASHIHCWPEPIMPPPAATLSSPCATKQNTKTFLTAKIALPIQYSSSTYTYPHSGL